MPSATAPRRVSSRRSAVSVAAGAVFTRRASPARDGRATPLSALINKLCFILESRRLRVLLAVARTGSLAAAADRLGYTPSAISQQIRALERELGTVVAERHGRGVVLTEPGRVLAEHAQRIVDALGAAEAELEAIAGLRAGVLRFAWFSTAGAVLVPRAIARFRD